MNKRAFFALFIVLFTALLGLGIIAPFMPIYAESKGATGVWLGLMYSGFALSRVVFMPFLGRLSDRRGRKSLMAAGLSAYCLISLAYVIAGDVYQLTAIRFFHGIASAMIMPIAQAYIADLIPKGKEGTYMNMFIMAVHFGIAGGPFLGGVLADAFTLNAGFYAMSGLSALALIMLIVLVPNIEPHILKGGKRSELVPFKTIIRDSKVIAISIFQASRSLYRQGIIAFLPILVVASFGSNMTNIGLMLTAFMLTAGIAQGIFGPLADRSSRTVMVAIGAFAAPALVFLIPYMGNIGFLFALLFFVAVTSALARSSLVAITIDLGNKYNGMGAVIGVSNSAQSLGQVVGPLLFGLIVDKVSIEAAFQIGGGMAFLATFAVVYFLVRRPRAIENSL